MSQNNKELTKDEEQEQDWLAIFNLLDKDHDGRITKDELGNLFRALDMDPTQKELAAAVKVLDKNGNGVIEFTDFKAYMLKTKKLSFDDRKHEIIAAFKIIDRNSDKFIDAQELIHVLTTIGEPLNHQEAEEMIKVADVNKDGKIDFEEFAKFITSPYHH